MWNLEPHLGLPLCASTMTAMVFWVKIHLTALEQCRLRIWHVDYLKDPGPHKGRRLSITQSQCKTQSQGSNPKPSLTNL